MKALRFLGVAILACSMLFVSCKKDKQYTITVNSNNTAWGTVTGGGTYAENATATLTATAKEGYKFVQWNDGNTSNPRTITVTADATYTATFAEEGTPGPNPPQPGEDGIKVLFNNSTSWDATTFAVSDEYLDYDGSLYHLVCKNYDAIETEPLVSGYAASEVGTTEDPDCEVCMFFYQANINDVFNYNDTDYPMWQPYSFSQNITAIDLNAHTLSSVVNAEVFNGEAYISSGGTDMTPVPLVVTYKNATWEVLSLSKGMAKGKNVIRK